MLRIFYLRVQTLMTYRLTDGYDINNTSPQEERRNINMCKVHFVKIMFNSSYLLSEPVVHLGQSRSRPYGSWI